MPDYIHELEGWPGFRRDEGRIARRLATRNECQMAKIEAGFSYLPKREDRLPYSEQALSLTRDHPRATIQLPSFPEDVTCLRCNAQRTLPHLVPKPRLQWSPLLD